MSKQIGTYTLLNTVNGKQYTGQLNCKIFQRAFAKYGKRCFRLIPGVEKKPEETEKKKPASWIKPKPYKKPQLQKDD